MPILTATNLQLAYGQRVILDGVSLSLEAGERIGVVGRNGAGKSSMLKIMAGLIPADSGTVALGKGARAGYLHQDPKLDLTETLRGAAESAFAELHRLHLALDKVFEEMGTAQGAALDKLLEKQSKLETQMEAAGGYAIDHKIGEVLHGLGFTDAQFSTPVGGLSGGQKGRLSLAKLLLEEPDVLLLDEPTNHLDIDGRLWLESFLNNEYEGAVILISHDRYLLDNVVNRIIEVEQSRLIDYPGNYLAFREIRAQRRLSMMRAYENEQGRFKKEEAYIRRYKAGQRAKQAQGRLSKLERAKESSTLERPMELATMALQLPKAPRSGDIVCSCRELSKKYPADDGTQKVLFRELDFSMGRGERWGIIGPNGAGKSTLVRCILGEQTADSGKARVGASVVIGHYQQTHDHLPMEALVYEYLQQVINKECPGTTMSEQAARNLAGAFLFTGGEQERPLHQLSGGERSRAVLAGLLASAKNLLVLDEPTNHLDIPAAERLEEALAPPDEETGDDGYEGSLLLISHDRALIDATCDHLLVFDGQGNVEQFAGNYSEWREKDLARKADKARAEQEARERRDSAEKARKASEEARRKPAPSAPRANNPLARLSLEDLDARMEKLNARIKAIDVELADAWNDPRRCHTLGEERTRLARDLEPLEFEWMSREGG
ncbi:MAG: ATP-binding cassette domain-containing protein [Phycisphaerales bacterium]